jgi:histidyl-tRNA synthetase
VQHQNEITFPFKRFQIQPVWRADRPQKGRYREFYQCDADVVGSDSLLNELDLLHIIKEVFEKLGTEIVIKVNNRKILAGIAGYMKHPEKITEMTTAIDKIEKIGIENVILELKDKGIDDEAITTLKQVLLISEKDSLKKLNSLKTMLADSPTGLKGIEELSLLLQYCQKTGIYRYLNFDLTLARGLNYYTGAIIEVKALEVEIGSICGGGRYDDLTGIFGLKNISGVGISFGADRIYDVMEQLKLFPEETETTSKALIVNFGENEMLYGLILLDKLHKNGIAAELYPDPAKLKKQLTYADSRKIVFVVMAGENEIRENLLALKNMVTGEQMTVSENKLMEILQANADRYS